MATELDSSAKYRERKTLTVIFSSTHNNMRCKLNSALAEGAIWFLEKQETKFARSRQASSSDLGVHALVASIWGYGGGSPPKKNWNRSLSQWSLF